MISYEMLILPLICFTYLSCLSREAISMEFEAYKEEVPIPEDLVDTVNEWREKLVEAVAEQDDTLMEKFFEDPDSITEDEMIAAIRKATIVIRLLGFTSATLSGRTRSLSLLIDVVLDMPPKMVKTRLQTHHNSLCFLGANGRWLLRPL